MASVSISHVILFIAAVAVAAMVATTATGVADDVSHALRDTGADAGDRLDTDFAIISDSGSDAIYDDTTTTVTLLVKNTGSSVLPTDPKLVDTLVDGKLYEESNITVVDGDYWRPGNVARITIDASLTQGPHRVLVRTNGRESVFAFPYRGGSSGTNGNVVFVGSVNVYDSTNGTTTTYVTSANVSGGAVNGIGPSIDFDSDGVTDVPYVNYDGNIRIAYGNGTVETVPGQPYGGSGTNTRLAVGTWNGSAESIFFGNSSGVYRVAPGGAPVQVSTQAAGSVAGTGDFDGDGSDELVFLGTSSGVSYLEPDGTVVDTGSNLGSNQYAIGEPADFDDDGRARLPFVDSSGYVSLFGYDNGTVSTPRPNDTTTVTKNGVGGHDMDGDGMLEIAFVNTNGNLAYMELDGSITVVTNSTGSTIPVQSPGVA